MAWRLVEFKPEFKTLLGEYHRKPFETLVGELRMKVVGKQLEIDCKFNCAPKCDTITLTVNKKLIARYAFEDDYAGRRFP